MEQQLSTVLKVLAQPVIRSTKNNDNVIRSINRKDIQEIQIPLPPLEVQKEIVAELDTYQKVIDGARQIIENWKPIIKIEPNWQKVKLEEVISTVIPPKKIKKENFLISGNFPIIDQSQNEISGWTNDVEALVKCDKPFVVFGDHTCVIKYIENPFAQGADGIKILKTSENLLPKFLYYFLKMNPIKYEGYKRHFTKLKQIQFPLPPIEIQKEIVSKIEKEQRIIDQLKNLIKNYEEKIKDKISEVWGQYGDS